MSYSVNPIGYVRSCFKEKFAIPRQPLLAPAAQGCIELLPPYDQADAIAGLDDISHIWVIFLFHKTLEDTPRLKVRPPRLGGNKSIGVFASRATHRPNGIGQSAVRLERAEPGRLWISSIDLLDGTPVLDIKPYLPYADALPGAAGGFADAAPQTDMTVSFSEQAIAFCQAQKPLPDLQIFIEKVLKQDPRPPYKKQRGEQQSYGMTLYNFNIKWTVDGEHNHVTEIRLQQTPTTTPADDAG